MLQDLRTSIRASLKDSITIVLNELEDINLFSAEERKRIVAKASEVVAKLKKDMSADTIKKLKEKASNL